MNCSCGINKATMHVTRRIVLCVIMMLLGQRTSANFVGGFIRQPTVCVKIPTDLKLCRNVGYNSMVLPNLFNHESLDEMRQQALSFVPLLNQHCHPHLQEFLCSLFAPVCLPPESAVSGPIPPCKSLCKSVERSCTPIMELHNFPWPPMLNCSQFTEQDPCVNLQPSNSTPMPGRLPTQSGNNLPSSSSPPISSTTPPSINICAPCGTELRADTLHDNFCASEFVLKIKIKRVKEKKKKGIYEIKVHRRKRQIYKTGPLTKNDSKRLKLIVRGTKQCSCSPIEFSGLSKKEKRKAKRSFFLVMGRKVGRKLFVTVLHRWSKRNRILKKASRKNFGAAQCPEFGNMSAL